jgi:hypothetical protein
MTGEDFRSSRLPIRGRLDFFRLDNNSYLAKIARVRYPFGSSVPAVRGRRHTCESSLQQHSSNNADSISNGFQAGRGRTPARFGRHRGTLPPELSARPVTRERSRNICAVRASIHLCRPRVQFLHACPDVRPAATGLSVRRGSPVIFFVRRLSFLFADYLSRLSGRLLSTQAPHVINLIFPAQ